METVVGHTNTGKLGSSVGVKHLLRDGHPLLSADGMRRSLDMPFDAVLEVRQTVRKAFGTAISTNVKPLITAVSTEQSVVF